MNQIATAASQSTMSTPFAALWLTAEELTECAADLRECSMCGEPATRRELRRHGGHCAVCADYMAERAATEPDEFEPAEDF